MEHRCGRRLRHSIPVVVCRAGQARIRCRTADLSPDGLFLALDTAAAGIREGEVIRIVPEDGNPFVDPREGDTAYVVHRRANGVGVMFTSLDGRTHRVVRDCLATTDEPPTNPLVRRLAGR
jgi:hypothetical protein